MKTFVIKSFSSDQLPDFRTMCCICFIDQFSLLDQLFELTCTMKKDDFLQYSDFFCQNLKQYYNFFFSYLALKLCCRPACVHVGLKVGVAGVFLCTSGRRWPCPCVCVCVIPASSHMRPSFATSKHLPIMLGVRTHLHLKPTKRDEEEQSGTHHQDEKISDRAQHKLCTRVSPDCVCWGGGVLCSVCLEKQT